MTLFIGARLNTAPRFTPQCRAVAERKLGFGVLSESDVVTTYRYSDATVRPRMMINECAPIPSRPGSMASPHAPVSLSETQVSTRVHTR